MSALTEETQTHLEDIVWEQSFEDQKASSVCERIPSLINSWSKEILLQCGFCYFLKIFKFLFTFPVSYCTG